MTEVWWCAVHRSPGGERECEYYKTYWNQHMSQCDVARMRLVPVDALVIVREDGNWPAKVQSKAAEAINDYAWSTMAYVDVDEDALAVLILDALAEAAKDNPQ